MRKIILKLVFGVLVTLFLASCSTFMSYKYWAPETRITLVDAQSNKPIEGATVLADWSVSYKPFFGSFVDTTRGRIETLVSFEVVSSSEGIIRLPAWGPERAGMSADIDRSSPKIRIFKQGYEFLELTNYPYIRDPAKDSNYDSPLPSEWNNKVIKLVPFKGRDEEYVRHLERLEHSLMWSGISCLTIKAKRMLSELDKMIAYFDAKKIRNHLYKVRRPCDEM